MNKRAMNFSVFQLTFTFTDGALGQAQESTQFVLTINIQRNLFTPVWVNLQDGFSMAVSEDRETHLEITSFAIRDDDVLVVTFLTNFFVSLILKVIVHICKD